MKNISPKYLYLGLIFIISPVLTTAQSESNTVYTCINQISENITAPVRIALDPKNNIYVSDVKQNRIIKYNTSGQLIKQIPLNFPPASIAVNKNEDLFIGDKNSGEIYKISSTGEISLFSDKCVSALSICFDSDEQMYVADGKQNGIIILDKNGNITGTLGKEVLTYPVCLFYDKRTNRILAGEHGGTGTGFTPECKIYVFDLQGNIINSFGSYGNNDGQFYRIQGITSGKCNNIYVSDPFQGTVSVFDKEYNFITKFGKFGNNPGELNMPLDIAFSEDEIIFVSSLNNGRIELFKAPENLPSSKIFDSDAVICPGDSTNIKIKLTGTPPWNFTYAVNGYAREEITSEDSIFTLKISEPGIYEIIKLSDNTNTGSCFTGSAVIKTPEILPSVSISSNDTLTCSEDTALIRFDFSGNAPWYFPLIYNDSAQTNIFTLNNPTFLPVTKKGTYEINKISDAFCTSANISETLTLSTQEKPYADFLYKNNNTEITFINTSENADSFLWDFGNGNISTEETPSPEFYSPGIYEISLTAKNKCGEDTVEKIVNITNSENNNCDRTFIKISPNPSKGTFILECNNSTRTKIFIEIISSSGKTVFSKFFYGKKIKEKINIENLPQGIYILKIKSSEFAGSLKLIIKR